MTPDTAAAHARNPRLSAENVDFLKKKKKIVDALLGSEVFHLFSDENTSVM